MLSSTPSGLPSHLLGTPSWSPQDPRLSATLMHRSPTPTFPVTFPALLHGLRYPMLSSTPSALSPHSRPPLSLFPWHSFVPPPSGTPWIWSTLLPSCAFPDDPLPPPILAIPRCILSLRVYFLYRAHYDGPWLLFWHDTPVSLNWFPDVVCLGPVIHV